MIQGLPYWRRSLQDYVVNYILARACSSRTIIRILDLGCGLGYTVARLSRLLTSRAEVVGIDVSRDVVEKARVLVKKAGGESKVQIVCIDAKRTRFRDSYFDIVIANLSFSVFKSPRGVASEVERILKPGGVIVATEVNKSSALGRIGELLDAATGHLYYMLYSPSELLNLFTSLGMRVKRVSRIPLTIRFLGLCLMLPSRVSPAFLADLSKPLVLNRGRRFN